MYASTAVAGVAVGAGTLAATGYASVWLILVSLIAIIGGLLLVRAGRRRTAQR